MKWMTIISREKSKIMGVFLFISLGTYIWYREIIDWCVRRQYKGFIGRTGVSISQATANPFD